LELTTQIAQLTSKMFQRDASKSKSSTGCINRTRKKLVTVKDYSLLKWVRQKFAMDRIHLVFDENNSSVKNTDIEICGR
jgi:hypothetical protein